MSKLKRIPSWLRWTLFLPASFLAMLVVFPIVGVISRETTRLYTGANNIFDKTITLTLANLASYVSFIYVGAVIAPKKQFIISIIMGIILSSFLAIMVFAKLLSLTSVTWLEVINCAVTGSIAICIIIYHFHKKEAKYERERAI